MKDQTKKCSKCQKLKSVVEFHPKKKRFDGLQTSCKKCVRSYQRKHYRKNKVRYQSLRTKARIRVMRLVYDYLLAHPCECGESDPAALDFDHNGGKRFNLAKAREGFGLDTVKEEISKCTVRCSNCHRKKTAKEQGWYALLGL